MSSAIYFNLGQSKNLLSGNELKAFRDGKLNFAKRTISLIDRVENTVGKGENTGYQHFLLLS